MSEIPTQSDEAKAKVAPARDASNWATPVDRLRVTNAPAGATNLNVDGRQTVGPLQGFGQLWQKTYQIRLSGVNTTPQEVIRAWKEHFPDFQPPENRFFPSVAGVKPGEVVLIDAMTPGGSVSTGVVVMYSDDESFALMTPQGHPESGWVTFSAFEGDDGTVAQIQSLARANDPIYEVAFRFVGSNIQEKIWKHVLTSVGTHFNANEPVQLTKICVDSKLQWSQMKNIVHNAQIRTLLYRFASPIRWLRGSGKPAVQ